MPTRNDSVLATRQKSSSHANPTAKICPDARMVTPLPTEELGCEPGDPTAHFLPSDTHEPRITLTRTNLQDDDGPLVALPSPRWLPPYSGSNNSPTLDLRPPHRQLQRYAVGTAAHLPNLYQMPRLDFKKNLPPDSRLTASVTKPQVVSYQPLKEAIVRRAPVPPNCGDISWPHCDKPGPRDERVHPIECSARPPNPSPSDSSCLQESPSSSLPEFRVPFFRTISACHNSVHGQKSLRPIPCGHQTRRQRE
jgi:hypothetical protein